jgi:hypothetical protein
MIRTEWIKCYLLPNISSDHVMNRDTHSWNLHASLYKSKTTIFRGTKDEARLECIQLEMTLKLRCLMVIALMLRARLKSNRCRRGQPDTSGDEAKDAETARNQGYISHGQDFQGAKRIPTCSGQPRHVHTWYFRIWFFSPPYAFPCRTLYRDICSQRNCRTTARNRRCWGFATSTGQTWVSSCSR